MKWKPGPVRPGGALLRELESPLALSLAGLCFRHEAAGSSIVEEADLTVSHVLKLLKHGFCYRHSKP